MGVDLLNIGRSGLGAAKKSLSTTSHNIANANTEGFSRQRANLEANRPIGEGNVVLGTGVDVKSIKRIHDDQIETRVNQSRTVNEYNNERDLQLMQVEQVFNEANSDGMNKLLNRFFNSFRELANQPENETVRSIVRENARLVVKDFRRMKNTIQDLHGNIDNKLRSTVDDINTMLHHVKGLNNKIAEMEALAEETGDLRDQRDRIVGELSELMDIHTFRDEKNRYVINAKGVGSLVVGGTTNDLKLGTTNKDAKDIGRYEIFYKNGGTGPISHKIKGGRIGAMLETRERELKNAGDRLDRLAYELSNTVNAIHRKGFINGKIPVDQAGNPIGRNLASGKQYTGLDFFKVPTEMYRAAEYLDLSDEVKEDLSNIATGLEPNRPGDNRIAIAISGLQHEKILLEGTTTFEEHYLEAVGDIGLIASKTRIDLEQSKGILAQSKSVKERISGVSIDEETANMIKFQHAYDASAKVIKTADEMFQSVLNIKR